MKPELVSLQRRPFLVPLWLTAGLAFFGLCCFVLAIWVWATAGATTVVVIRHAEKDVSVNPTDPPLSAAGQARAELLARMFGAAKAPGRLDAIYVSPALRNRETGKPLSVRLGVAETVVPAGDPKGLARRALREHRGGRALIIGHSDTVPAIVAQLSGEDAIPDLGDQEYGTMYIVTVPRFGHPNLLRLTY